MKEVIGELIVEKLGIFWQFFLKVGDFLGFGDLDKDVLIEKILENDYNKVIDFVIFVGSR